LRTAHEGIIDAAGLHQHRQGGIEFFGRFARLA
jgi:hypothetical protein